MDEVSHIDSVRLGKALASLCELVSDVLGVEPSHKETLEKISAEVQNLASECADNVGAKTESLVTVGSLAQNALSQMQAELNQLKAAKSVQEQKLSNLSSAVNSSEGELCELGLQVKSLNAAMSRTGAVELERAMQSMDKEYAQLFKDLAAWRVEVMTELRNLEGNRRSLTEDMEHVKTDITNQGSEMASNLEEVQVKVLGELKSRADKITKMCTELGRQNRRIETEKKKECHQLSERLKHLAAESFETQESVSELRRSLEHAETKTAAAVSECAEEAKRELASTSASTFEHFDHRCSQLEHQFSGLCDGLSQRLAETTHVFKSELDGIRSSMSIRFDTQAADIENVKQTMYKSTCQVQNKLEKANKHLCDQVEHGFSEVSSKVEDLQVNLKSTTTRVEEDAAAMTQKLFASTCKELHELELNTNRELTKLKDDIIAQTSSLQASLAQSLDQSAGNVQRFQTSLHDVRVELLQTQSVLQQSTQQSMARLTSENQGEAAAWRSEFENLRAELDRLVARSSKQDERIEDRLQDVCNEMGGALRSQEEQIRVLQKALNQADAERFFHIGANAQHHFETSLREAVQTAKSSAENPKKPRLSEVSEAIDCLLEAVLQLAYCSGFITCSSCSLNRTESELNDDGAGIRQLLMWHKDKSLATQIEMGWAERVKIITGSAGADTPTLFNLISDCSATSQHKLVKAALHALGDQLPRGSICSSTRAPSPKEIGVLRNELPISGCDVLEDNAGCGLGSTWSTTNSRMELHEDDGQRYQPSTPRAPVLREVGTPSHQLPNLRQCQGSALPTHLRTGLDHTADYAKMRMEHQQKDGKKNATSQPRPLAPCPQPAEKIRHSQQGPTVESVSASRRPAELQQITPELPREPQELESHMAQPRDTAKEPELDEARHDEPVRLPWSHINLVLTKPMGTPPAGNPPLQRRLHSGYATSGEAI
eukprot:TRINITY_DN44337_c0_g1_i1.p1 TRINITY_DN44337_c0_g1~~TRINITY_DN44337_c0_g1_i1.p1  ORF type:complete len:945 (-),score=188.14 TRINITY_DN44337_c0_g1_i1:568-3402(-)